MPSVRVLVPGGKATPGPPLGPALGPLGINIKAVVDEINAKTKDFEGMNVPVTITVKEDKSFTVEVGSPPTSALLLRELGVEKGAKQAGKETIGDLPLEKIIKVARMKRKSLRSSMKGCVKQVLGTCVSMGIRVNGKDPRDIQRMIDSGEIKIEEA